MSHICIKKFVRLYFFVTGIPYTYSIMYLLYAYSMKRHTC